MMIRLNNDYSEGCHPSILLRLNEMNLEQNPGYGTDTHCAEAADAVRKAFYLPGCGRAFPRRRYAGKHDRDCRGASPV